MKRYHIFKDGQSIAAMPTREEAIEYIRRQQDKETHPVLRSEFSIIYGEEEFISYGRKKK